MSSSPSTTKLSPQEFAARIKSKYPGMYDDLDDDILTRRILSKHSQYNDLVDLPDLDKPLDFDTIKNEASKHGLTLTSNLRTPEHNKAVGGAKNSYHLSGKGFDFAGSKEQQQKFYDYMRDTYGGRFAEILNEGDHIHIASEFDSQVENEVTNSNNITPNNYQENIPDTDNISAEYKSAKFDPFSGKPTQIGLKATKENSTFRYPSKSKKPSLYKKDNLIPSENIKDVEDLDNKIKNLSEARNKFINQGFPADTYKALDDQIIKLSQIKNDISRVTTVPKAEFSKQNPSFGVESKEQKKERQKNDSFLTKGYFANFASGVQEGVTGLGDVIHGVGKMAGIENSPEFLENVEQGHKLAAETASRGNEGILADVASGAGRLAIDLPLLAAGGLPALTLSGAAHEAAREDAKPLDVAKGAVINYTIGRVLHTGRNLTIPKRALLGATTFGGVTAATGGNQQQIISQAMLGAGLGTLGGKKEKKFEKNSDYVGKTVQDAEGNLFRIKDIKGDELELEPFIQVESQKGFDKPRVNLLESQQGVSKNIKRFEVPELESEFSQLKNKEVPKLETKDVLFKEGEGYRKPNESIESFYNRQMEITAPERRVSFEKFKQEYEAAQSESYGPEPSSDYKINPELESQLGKGTKPNIPKDELIEKGYPALGERREFDYGRREGEKRLDNVENTETEDYIFKPLETSEISDKTFYHGTKAKIKNINEADPEVYGKETALYGPGLYLTDNPRVAGGYARTKGKGKTGQVFAGNIKDANLVDLDKPFSQDIQNTLENVHISYNEPIGKIEGKTGREVIANLREAMADEGIYSAEAIEIFQDIQAQLKTKGYDGFKHIGGKEGKGEGQHNVVILWPDYTGERPLSNYIKPFDESIKTEIKPTMTPEGSGSSVISNEELNRNETFYKVSKSGSLTYQGKQPDNLSLKPDEAIVAVKENGEMRVSNGDGNLLEKYGHVIQKARQTEEGLLNSINKNKDLKTIKESEIYDIQLDANIPQFIKDSYARIEQVKKGNILSANPVGITVDFALTKGYELYKTIKDKTIWLSEMVKRYGEEVKPHLEEVWSKLSGIETVEKSFLKGNENIQESGVRSFPKNLRRNEILNLEDMPYDIITDKASEARADSIIQEKGIDAAIEHARSQEASKDNIILTTKLVDQLAKLGDDRAGELAREEAIKLTEAGQTIQAAKIAARLGPANAIKVAQENLTKKGKTLTGEEAKEIHEVATKYKETADKIKENTEKVNNLETETVYTTSKNRLSDKPIEVKQKKTFTKKSKPAKDQLVSEIKDLQKVANELAMKLAKLIQKPALGDKISWYQRANLMSGPAGAARDILSTGLWQAMDNVIFRPTRAAIEQTTAKFQKREPEVFVSETIPAIKGWIGGIAPGLKEGFNVIKHGYSEIEAQKRAEKFDTPTHYEGPGGAANPLNQVLRIRQALNEIQTYMGRNAELHVEAYRVVRKEGLKGNEAKSRYDELIENPTTEMIQKAEKYSEYSTFTDKSDKLLNAFYGLRDLEIPRTGIKPGQLIYPFVRTTYNLMKRGVELTPLGVTKLLKKNLTSVEKADIVGKAALGSAFMTYIAMNTELTGGVPKEYIDKKKFYDEGKRPYSIKIKGYWIPFENLGPVGIPMAIVAAFKDKYRKDKYHPLEKDTTKAAMASAKQVFIDQTALRTMGEWYDAISGDSKSKGLQEIIGKQASTYVPFSQGLRTVAESQDEYLRDPKIWYEWIMQGMPGLRPKVLTHRIPIENTKKGLKSLSPIVPTKSLR